LFPLFLPTPIHVALSQTSYFEIEINESRENSELGLRGKDSNGVARPMSFMGTQLTMAGLAGWGVWLVKEDFKAKLGF
jgi:hypothetical protein